MSEDLDPAVVRPISPVVQADLSRLLTISLLIPGREEPLPVQVDGIDVLRDEEWRDVFRVVLSARGIIPAHAGSTLTRWNKPA